MASQLTMCAAPAMLSVNRLYESGVSLRFATNAKGRACANQEEIINTSGCGVRAPLLSEPHTAASVPKVASSFSPVCRRPRTSSPWGRGRLIVLRRAPASAVDKVGDPQAKAQSRRPRS